MTAFTSRWVLVILISATCVAKVCAQVTGDFNGDLFADLAIGVPGEDVNGNDDAGAVNVLYGSPAGLTGSGDQFWHQNSAGVKDPAEPGDQFGYTLACGDFDGDGFHDLAIGIPFEDVNSISNPGAIAILYGSSEGLHAGGDQFIHQDLPGMQEENETDDFLGDALTAGDFDGDGFDDLAIGDQFEDVDDIFDAGVAHILYGSPSGLDVEFDQLIHQSVPGVKDKAEQDDLFGLSLASGDFDDDGFADLAIGVPGETISEQFDAGAVNVLYGSPAGITSSGDRFFHQDSDGVNNNAEESDFLGIALCVGDFDGDFRDDLAIGVSDEDLDSIGNAGAVHVFYGSFDGLRGEGSDFWHQNIEGIADSAQPDDFFGLHLASGDFNNDGRDELVIGVPQENLGFLDDAGAVHVLRGSPTGVSATGDQFWHQDVAGFANFANHDDAFGAGMRAGDFDLDGRHDLAIAIPFEDVGDLDAGAVSVIYGTSNGLSSAGDQFLHQNADGIADSCQENDAFGLFDDPF